MMIRLLVVGLWLSSAIATPQHTFSTPFTVSEIQVHRMDVFEPDRLGILGPLGEIGNAIHTTTREGVIRDFLLFETGDTIRAEVIAESERVLRESGLFESAEISVDRTEDGAVVSVTTRDIWSTHAIFDFGTTGGNNRVSLGLAESNLFGTGNFISGTHSWSDERNTLQFSLLKRRFFGRRAHASARYSESEDGISRNAQLSQPFFSTRASWSGRIFAAAYRGRVWLYQDGEKSGSYGLSSDHVLSDASLYMGNSARWRIGLGFFLRDQISTPLTGDVLELGPLRSDRRRQITLTVGRLTRRFIHLRNIDHYGVVEDLAMGTNVSVAVGAELEALGSTANRPTMTFDARSSNRWGRHEYTSLGVAATSYWRNSSQMERELDVRVRAFSTRLANHTPAAHFLLRRRLGFPEESFFSLGAENGLRGYPFRAYRGKTLLLANLEDRVAPLVSVLFFRIGFALFMDAGYAWDEGEPLHLGDMRTDAGVGIRIGNPKSATNVMRLDVARGLGPDGGWQISLLSGNLFSLMSRLDYEPLVPQRGARLPN